MFIAPGGNDPGTPPPTESEQNQVVDSWNSVQNFFGSWGRGTYALMAQAQVAANNVRK